MNEMTTTTNNAAAMMYSKIADPLQYCEQMGKSLAVTFALNSPHHGTIMAMTCMTEGISPPVYHARYHADGSMRASSIQAEFERRNNPIDWVNLGDDGKFAEAIFTRRDGKPHTIRYTWEDATKQVGDKIGKAGSNWATNPGAMLRAALIRKAVKILDPGIIGGYDDFDEFQDQRPAVKVEAVKTATVWTVTAEPTQPEIETVAEPVEHAPFDTPAEVAAIPDGDDDHVTPELLTELTKLMLKLPGQTIESINEVMCKKWGISRPQDAKCGKVRETIANVRAKLAQ